MDYHFSPEDIGIKAAIKFASGFCILWTVHKLGVWFLNRWRLQFYSEWDEAYRTSWLPTFEQRISKPRSRLLAAILGIVYIARLVAQTHDSRPSGVLPPTPARLRPDSTWHDVYIEATGTANLVGMTARVGPL